MATKKFKRRKVKAPQPNRIDPTRTVTLRKRLVAEVRRRFAAIRAEIFQLLVKDDAFDIAGRTARMVGQRAVTFNAFCATGPGGGIDPSCGKDGGGSSSISGKGSKASAKVALDKLKETDAPAKNKGYKGTFVKVPFKTEIDEDLDQTLKQIIRDNEPTSRKVSLDAVTATQSAVRKATVEVMIDSADDSKSDYMRGPVIIVKYNGKTYLHDGHHRATTAKLQGVDKVDAKVYAAKVRNVFCATGEGGGVDPSCKVGGSGGGGAGGGGTIGSGAGAFKRNVDPMQYKDPSKYAYEVMKDVEKQLKESNDGHTQYDEMMKSYQHQLAGEISEEFRSLYPGATEEQLAEKLKAYLVLYPPKPPDESWKNSLAVATKGKGLDKLHELEPRWVAHQQWREAHGYTDIQSGAQLTKKEILHYLKGEGRPSRAYESDEPVRQLPKSDQDLIYQYTKQDKKPEGEIAEALNRAVGVSQPLEQDIVSYRGLRLPDDKAAELLAAIENNTEAIMPLAGPSSFSLEPTTAKDFASSKGHRSKIAGRGLVLKVLVPKGTRVAAMHSGINTGWEHVISGPYQLRLVKADAKKDHTVLSGILEPKARGVANSYVFNESGSLTVEDVLNVFCPTGDGGGIDPSCGDGATGGGGGTSSQSSDSAASASGWGRSGAKIAFVSPEAEEVLKTRGLDKESVALMAGATTGADVSIVLNDEYEDDDRLFVQVMHPDYYAKRVISDTTIFNKEFYAKDTGTGLGTKLFSQQVAEAAKAGFKQIKCTAQRDKHANGYYTWARLGYDGKVPMGQHGGKKISELMKTAEGRAWWKEHGQSFDGTFDLTEGSQSRRVLDAYNAERAARAAKVANVFCATGEGGGVDPTCGSGGTSALGLEPTPSPSGNHVVWEKKGLGHIRINLKTESGIPSVERIFVDGDQRGQGIASKMYLEMVKRYGAITSAESGNTNSAAAAVWRSIGGRSPRPEDKTPGVDFILRAEELNDGPRTRGTTNRAGADAERGGRGDPGSGMGSNRVGNVFCATGEGGGVDPTCSPLGQQLKTYAADPVTSKKISYVSAAVFSGGSVKSAGIQAGATDEQVRIATELTKQIADAPVMTGPAYRAIVFTKGEDRDAQLALKKTLDNATVGTQLTIDRIASFTSDGSQLDHYFSNEYHGEVVESKYKLELRGEYKALATDQYTGMTHKELLTQGNFTVSDVSQSAGVKVIGLRQRMKHTTNARAEYQFKTSSEQVKAFQQWLASIYGKHLSVQQLMKKYAEDGYKRGIGRAFDDVEKPHASAQAIGTTGQPYIPSREQFLRAAFGSPIGQERVTQLASRSFDDLKNVTADMSARLSRTLLDGLVSGAHPMSIAKGIAKDMDISLGRAETIARTEVIRAHAEGQLDAMEAMGVQQVGVQVEWVTARDDAVCDRCSAMEGLVLDLDKAHGLLPLHPRCRCAWLPAGDPITQPTLQEAAGAGYDGVDNAAYWRQVINVYCATGEGGGVDPSCGTGGSATSTPKVTRAANDILDKAKSLGGSEWKAVRIADLRDELGESYTHEDVTTALWKLHDSGRIHMVHADDPRDETERDRIVPTTRGGQNKYKLYVTGA